MHDHIDDKIIQVLQSDSKTTNSELASIVNLSPTACLNRVKKLEKSGVIAGYKAVIDPAKAGYNISALVLIKINNNTREAAALFTKALKKTRAIKECHMTAGSKDYIARVYAKDFEHYEFILKNELADLPNIGSLETLFLFSNLIPDRPFELAES